MKRKILGLLCAILCFTCSGNLTINAVDESISKDLLQNNMITMYSRFIDYTNKQYEDSLKSDNTFTFSSSKSIYNNDYAGAYYDNQTHMLNILLINNNNINFYKSFFDSTVDFSIVDYSYNDLIKLQEFVDNQKETMINYSYIKQSQNQLVVSVLNKNDEANLTKILEEQGYNKDMINFIIEPISDAIETTDFANSGKRILANGYNNFPGTICIDATRNCDGTILKGFVTAGHITNNYTMNIPHKNEQLNRIS